MVKDGGDRGRIDKSGKGKVEPHDIQVSDVTVDDDFSFMSYAIVLSSC